jgi:hypothetical protein
MILTSKRDSIHTGNRTTSVIKLKKRCKNVALQTEESSIPTIDIQKTRNSSFGMNVMINGPCISQRSVKTHTLKTPNKAINYKILNSGVEQIDPFL